MKTEILTVDPVDPNPEVLAQAARLIAGGGIVAFPTETVYGLAVDPENPRAIGALRKLKGRDEGKNFTLHLAEKSQVLDRLDRCPWRAAKLMDRYWPGPLTLVLVSREGKEVGFRVPSGAVPHGFLSACPRGVFASSANEAGEAPAASAQAVLAMFDGKIAAVLDGGRAPLAQSSGIVRVVGSDLSILRDGIVTREQIVGASCRTVLFICTGNTCRSPMAQGLLRKFLADAFGVPSQKLLEKGFRVASAGVFSGSGSASPQAIQAVAEKGGDIRDHEARQLTRKMLLAADQVYTMGRAHLERAVEIAPEAAGRIRLLSRGGQEVPDPVWGELAVYKRCADLLGRLIRERMGEILGDEA